MLLSSSTRQRLIIAFAAAAFAHPSAAQPSAAPQPPAAPSLRLALSGAAPSEAGCRLSLVANNGMGTDITDLAFDVAVFRTDSALERIVRVPFGLLIEGRSRVRQFDVKAPCGDLGSVLVNDIAACAGTALTPDLCQRGLAVSSSTAVDFTL